MPFTPFHVGPGLLLKGAIPSSLTTFVATQIVIDCETAYHILRSEYPLHRFCHTLIGATLVGCAVVALVGALGRWSALRRHGDMHSFWPGEASMVGVLIGGVVGGISHSLLDSVVHPDVRPFWPLSASSPLYGCLGWGTVELICIAAAVVGAVLMLVRYD